MTTDIGTEDIKEILFYLDPIIRGLDNGEQWCGDQLVRTLQDVDGGLGQYRLATSLKTRMRNTMMELVRSEVRQMVETSGSEVTPELMQQTAPVILQRVVNSVRWTEYKWRWILNTLA